VSVYANESMHTNNARVWHEDDDTYTVVLENAPSPFHIVHGDSNWAARLGLSTPGWGIYTYADPGCPDLTPVEAGSVTSFDTPDEAIRALIGDPQ
jgi:hypothetical protein